MNFAAPVFAASPHSVAPETLRADKRLAAISAIESKYRTEINEGFIPNNTEGQPILFLRAAEYFDYKNPLDGISKFSPLEQMAYTCLWLRDVIGRSDRCPAIKPCLQIGSLYMTNCPKESSMGDHSYNFIIDCIRWFKSLPFEDASSDILRALVITFPFRDELESLKSEIGNHHEAQQLDIFTAEPTALGSKFEDSNRMTPPILSMRRDFEAVSKNRVWKAIGSAGRTQK